LNSKRPPVFCPGCSHERIVHALDRAFQNMGLAGEQIAIVSDIGCSGLFDTFFNTHALHGLHGRALTYATGIKMARPDLHVVVTMGDGGLGIGGAHVLSTCRRNIDLTLLVLNNFNYGMTGGQCSSTTPREAEVASGFLNRLEKPIDICQVAGAAGAGMVARVSTYAKNLVDNLVAAISFEGFSLIDIWGICPGRYTRRNKLTPGAIDDALEKLPDVGAFKDQNARREYGRAYREEAARLKPVAEPPQIDPMFKPPVGGRQEVVVLGSAGQRIITAGEILCLAGMTAGLHATQKNDYPITVMRGHSVSELILSETEIDYTGIERPSTVIVLAAEGIARRKTLWGRLTESALVLAAAGLAIPDTAAAVESVDFKALKIKSPDWALAALACLARKSRVLSLEMLEAALALRFKGRVLEQALALVERVVGESAGNTD
jgi:pyruvate/2-oxoacid:ferredoxin oxidoreductase beta subunit/Pyruvate/2-oxoacid:ferredoxin oxidoreductase gamma subunit